MADNYIGEIRLFAGYFAPVGWAICNGALLSIQEHQELFSLIGNTYGGDGINSFALPDFKEKIPVHKSLPNIKVGVKFGTEAYTIKTENMPPHTHTFNVMQDIGTNSNPSNMMFAKLAAAGANKGLYSKNNTNVTNLNENFLSTTGLNAPASISNMMPTITLNYIIALTGYYPSRP